MVLIELAMAGRLNHLAKVSLDVVHDYEEGVDVIRCGVFGSDDVQ